METHVRRHMPSTHRPRAPRRRVCVPSTFVARTARRQNAAIDVALGEMHHGVDVTIDQQRMHQRAVTNVSDDQRDPSRPRVRQPRAIPAYVSASARRDVPIPRTPVPHEVRSQKPRTPRHEEPSHLLMTHDAPPICSPSTPSSRHQTLLQNSARRMATVTASSTTAAIPIACAAVMARAIAPSVNEPTACESPMYTRP